MPDAESIQKENLPNQNITPGNVSENIAHEEPSDNGQLANEFFLQPETIESTQLQIPDSKLQTENMEVHHHPKVEKKNFKEYFLEGLMIFLAVTLGFFAECLREHIIDKSKEQEYISSLKK